MTDANQCELSVTFNSDELDHIKTAADICGQPVAEFIVDAAFDKAVSTILAEKVAFISDDAYQRTRSTILDFYGKNRG